MTTNVPRTLSLALGSALLLAATIFLITGGEVFPTDSSSSDAAAITSLWGGRNNPTPTVYNNPATTKKGCTCSSPCTTSFAWNCYSAPYCKTDSCGSWSWTLAVGGAYWDWCAFPKYKPYEQRSAKDKHSILMAQVYADKTPGPWTSPTGVLTESVRVSFDNDGDVFAMPNRQKMIHPVGTVAPIKFVAAKGSPYTGIFQGADFGLIRLGAAVKPSNSEGMVSGAGIKFLVDGTTSVNTVAMQSLDGHKCSETNFLHGAYTNHPMTTLPWYALKQVVTRKFWQASNCPKMVGLSHWAALTQDGKTVSSPNFPYQVFFRSAQKVTVTCDNYLSDLKNFEALAPGSTLFEVYATSGPSDAAGSESHIGTVSLTGKFSTSKFGDTRLFFQHGRMESDFTKKPSWLNQGELSSDKGKTDHCGMTCIGPKVPSVSNGCSATMGSSCPFGGGR